MQQRTATERDGDRLTESAPPTGLDIVDLERYPLHEPAGDDLRVRIDEARRELDQDGCCVLPGFIRRSALEALAAESRELARLAYFSSTEATVYGGEPDPRFAADHPRQYQIRRDNGFVAGDHISATAAIRRLYHAAEFQDLLCACLELDTIHEYADPIAQLVVNVLQRGKGHGWHFDTNEFTVTLVTQAPAAGGSFEYVPHLRNAGDENFDGVAAVLEGDSTTVRRLDLRLGDLQLFRGRYSLHRVSPVEGSRDRLTTIFSYTERPGVVGDRDKTRRLYGRLTDSHGGDTRRADGLTG